MSSDSVIAIQAISFVFAISSVGLMAYAIKSGRVDWKLLALPILLLGNLSLFLFERLIVKLGNVVVPVPPGFINGWAIFIQLQLALTTFFVIGLTIIDIRLNGSHERGDETDSA